MRGSYPIIVACILGVAIAAGGCTANKTTKGAAIGTGAGAATGAIIGAVVGVPELGAIIGAGAGGTVGALVGHTLEKRDKDTEEREAMEKQLEDLEVGSSSKRPNLSPTTQESLKD
ncbi:MAG: glycine zipper domain-containing protein [Candidatus Brocadiales bacterium]